MTPPTKLERNSFQIETKKYKNRKVVPFTVAMDLLREEKKQRECVENQLKELIGPYNEIKAIQAETLKLKEELIKKLKQDMWVLQKMLELLTKS